MIDRKTIIHIIIIFCIALTVGNAFGWLFAKIVFLPGDVDGFDRMSLRFAVHGDLDGSVRLPPAFPVFMGSMYRIFGASYNSYVFFQSILLGILAILVYLISLESFKSRKIALVTGLITIIFPTILWYVPRYWIELLFASFAIIMLWSASKAIEKPTARNLIVFGVVTGLTALCKAVVLLFPLFLAFFVLFLRIIKAKPFEKLATGRIIGLFLIPTTIMILVLSPWTIRNRIVTGKWLLVSSNSSVEFLRGNAMAENNSFLPQNTILEIWGEVVTREHEILREHGNEDPSDIEKDEIFNPIMKDFILHRPFDFALKIVKQIPAFWINGETTFKSLVFLAISLPTIVLFIIGFAATHRELFFANAAIILLVYFNLIYAAVLAFARYSMPMYPPMLILAVYAVFQIFEKVKTLRSDEKSS